MFHLLDFFSLPIIQSNDYLSYDNKLLFLVICDCASMDKICNLSLYRKKNSLLIFYCDCIEKKLLYFVLKLVGICHL